MTPRGRVMHRLYQATGPLRAILTRHYHGLHMSRQGEIIRRETAGAIRMRRHVTDPSGRESTRI